MQGCGLGGGGGGSPILLTFSLNPGVGVMSNLDKRNRSPDEVIWGGMDQISADISEASLRSLEGAEISETTTDDIRALTF